MAVDSPNVVTVSGYDAAVRGFRMKVVGCLTCDEPVQTPAAGKRFLTLKAPARDADSMGAGVAVARPNIPFDTLGEARAWETTVKPNLRAEFVFKGDRHRVELPRPQGRGLRAGGPAGVRPLHRARGLLRAALAGPGGRWRPAWTAAPATRPASP